MPMHLSTSLLQCIASLHSVDTPAGGRHRLLAQARFSVPSLPHKTSHSGGEPGPVSWASGKTAGTWNIRHDFLTASKSPAGPVTCASTVNPPSTVLGMAPEPWSVANPAGERLACLLFRAPSAQQEAARDVVVLCHGFRSQKLNSLNQALTHALLAAGVSVICFDFSGNGESEGPFQYGNFAKEAKDLHAVVTTARTRWGLHVAGICGHSKGGNCVLLYASSYGDVPRVANLAGRFEMAVGVAQRLGVTGMQRLLDDPNATMTITDSQGAYEVTSASLRERLNLDMHGICSSIPPSVSVLTIHGDKDEVVPVADASSIANLVPKHQLMIVNGSDHNLTRSRKEVIERVAKFLTTK
eukprot:jgi/Mesvir1/3571/Mv12035-RA.1